MERENAFPYVGIATLLVMGGVVALWVTLRPDRGNDYVNTLQRVRMQDTIRIGYANEAPYGYLDSRTGRVTGEAPEIAQEIIRRMGIRQVEPVVTEFGSLIPGLKAGRFDIIAAGMYITPQRCNEIAFSNPTYGIGESFIVVRGNPLDLHSFEDVAVRGAARLGVVGGTVEHGYARSVGVPEDRIVVFPDNVSGLEAVRTGRVDAFAATILTVNDLLRKAGDSSMERADPFHDPVIDGRSVRGFGAFGFRKQDRQLVEEFNQKLAEFIGSEAHLKLVESFGFSADTLPGDVTAKQLCCSDTD